MRKLLVTEERQERTGYEWGDPYNLPVGAFDEIGVEGVIERCPHLVGFICSLDAVLAPGGKIIISAPHYASTGAWEHPYTKRGISESSLNFVSKAWRESKKTLLELSLDLEVVGQVAIEQSLNTRNQETKDFWLRRYNNVAQCILFTLTKKGQSDVG